MRIGILFTATLPLLLAACSAEPDEPAPSASPSASGQPAVPLAMASIPQPWHGIWDWTGGSCDPASDMRLEIAPNAIRFYESTGRVVKAELVGATLAVDLAMSGEGEEWQQRTMLTLAGPDELVSEMPAPSGDGRLRYRRCPPARQ